MVFLFILKFILIIYESPFTCNNVTSKCILIYFLWIKVEKLFQCYDGVLLAASGVPFRIVYL